MKKLILSLTIAAFAVAVQAGETKACKEGAKSACCSEKTTEKTAMKTSTEAKSGGCCSESKSACSEKASKGKVTESKVLMSPKAAAEVASR